MKKFSLILAALVLFAGVSFASNKKQDDKSKAKTEKKAAAPAKDSKGAKSDKKADTKTKTAPADKK